MQYAIRNTQYDTIIIGAGHNGLVTAAYLARAGHTVLVLERRSLVGGAVVTEEIFPGYHVSSVADGAGRLLPQIVEDLQLRQHGLDVVPVDPVIVAPQPDGSRLTIWRSAHRTAQEIAQFSERDAARYPEFIALMNRLAGVLTDVMTMTPPDIGGPRPSDAVALLKVSMQARRLGKQDLDTLIRILPMAIEDLLDDWFESDQLKGVIAAEGVTGLTFGPKAAGTVYRFLTRCAGGAGFPSAGIIKGGIGTLTQALAGAARAHGAEIRTDAEVARVIVADERASGVVLADGTEIAADLVISNADPRTSFLSLVGPQHFEPSFLRAVRHITYRGSCARVHLALDSLPAFTALDTVGDPVHVLAGHIRIAPNVDYLERGYDAAKYGDVSPAPYLDVRVPSVLDRSLVPAGMHLVSIHVQYAPYHLKDGEWNDQTRENLGDIVVDTLAEYAPEIKDHIVHRRVLTPLDLETIYGLPEGNPSHGEMTLDQFLYMRPVPGWAQYRTPIDNLWLCGAGTHPGGDVTGIPGYNAAREILNG